MTRSLRTRLTPLAGLAALLLCWIPSAAAAEGAAKGSVVVGLHDSLKELEPFLGVWELETAWANGQKLWSKSEYTPVLNGRFVRVITRVRDGDGEPYTRYRALIGAGAQAGEFEATSFQNDGSKSAVTYRMTEPGHLEWEWSTGQMNVRESYRSLDAENARWRVFMRQGEEGEWGQMLDGTWKKAERETAPIDDSLFVAAGPGVRSLEVSETIAASPQSLFAAFSSREGFLAAYGPERTEIRANIDLAIGGRYEWLFDGKIGSNECQVLSYVPDRMISFTWNAPVAQGENRHKRTWVVVDFAPASAEGEAESTRVRLTHLGFGEGPKWDETYAYFQEAWSFVLATFKKNFETSP
ncbi:MAG: SRPBCC domain-containing protein [Acidobacteriota bacterium]